MLTNLVESQFSIDNPLFGYQARTVEFNVHGRSGKIEDRMSGQTIKVVASSAGRTILEIDPGLGKSRIGIAIGLELCPQGKILVVCSKKALNTWRREYPKWTSAKPSDVVIIEGSPAQRKKLWAIPSRIKVITYQSGMRDEVQVKTFAPEYIISDECKLMRNRKTKAFKFWSKIMHKVKYVVLMDGTLVSRGPQDLWTFLNIIKPKTFSSFWKYANAFCLIVDGSFGKEFAGAKNTKNLANMLGHNMIRLKDSDPEVADQRPPLVRDFKLVEMSSEQSKLYKDLTDDLLAVTKSGEVIATPSQLALQIRQRQILICPKILDSALGYGSAIEHLMLEAAEDPHIVVFTPFTKAIPFISAALKSATGQEPYVLKGGSKSTHVGMVEDEFNSPVGAKRACICSVGFAESFELWTAKQGFFVGFDWSQLLNYQAEKRLHRLITPHPVNIWYYRYMNTVEDNLLEVLNTKQGNTNITFQNYIAAINLHKEAS